MPTQLELPFLEKQVILTTILTVLGIFGSLLIIRNILAETGTVLPLLLLIASSLIVFIGSPLITRFILDQKIGINEVLKTLLIIPLALITVNFIDVIDNYTSSASINIIALVLLTAIIHINSILNFTKIDRVKF